MYCAINRIFGLNTDIFQQCSLIISVQSQLFIVTYSGYKYFILMQSNVAFHNILDNLINYLIAQFHRSFPFDPILYRETKSINDWKPTIMELFQSVQKCLVRLGIRTSINITFFKILLLFILSSISVWKFFFCEAQLFEEYAGSFYGGVMVVIIIFDFLIFIWKSKQIFEFIRTFENLIETSKYVEEFSLHNKRY